MRISQITMTTGWLLLLVVVVSFQSVDSHCAQINTILSRQQQILQQLQLIVKRLGKLYKVNL